MEDKEIIRKLHELGKDRSYVLYGMLIGKDRKEIAKQIAKGVDMVQKHQSAIYRIFGAKVKGAELYEKAGKIFFLVTPVSEFVSPKKDWIEFNIWVWPPFKLTQMLHEVEKEQIAEEVKVVTTNVAEPAAKRQSFQIITVIVVIFIVVIGVYYLVNLPKSPEIVQKTTVMAPFSTITVPMNTQTATLSPTNTTEPTLPIVIVPSPTIEYPTQPVIVPVFIDHFFDNKIDNRWVVRSVNNQPIFLSNRLTTNQSGNESTLWMTIDADWINYKVELSFIKNNVSNSYGKVGIGVRYHNGESVVLVTNPLETNWIKGTINGQEAIFKNIIPDSEIKKWYLVPALIEVTVVGKNITFYANKEFVNSVDVPDMADRGGVVLAVGYGALVSDLFVTALP